MFTVGEDKLVKCWDLETNKVLSYGTPAPPHTPSPAVPAERAREREGERRGEGERERARATKLCTVELFTVKLCSVKRCYCSPSQVIQHEDVALAIFRQQRFLMAHNPACKWQAVSSIWFTSDNLVKCWDLIRTSIYDEYSGSMKITTRGNTPGSYQSL